jgi:hypothetical protein
LYADANGCKVLRFNTSTDDEGASGVKTNRIPRSGW